VPELQVVKAKPIIQDDERTLNEIAMTGIQLGNGGQRTFQSGPKFQIMQEMYGTSSHKRLLLVVLTKKAQYLAVPEPMVSRSLVTHYLHISQDTSDASWVNHGWRDFSNYIQEPRLLAAKPTWSLMLFAAEFEVGDLASHLESTVIETIEDRIDMDNINSSSLPDVLKVLANGTEEQKLRMLTSLHKRLNHPKPAAMRKLLTKSGIPIRVLALVDAAVDLCVQCKRWAVPHSSPAVRTHVASRFNFLVYVDLLFISDPAIILMIILDDAIRFCVVAPVLSRDFATLTSTFRRSWTKWFGPPEFLRTDSESALAHEGFGIYCEQNNITRELVLAKDAHTQLSPLDRKVKILRLAGPRIIESLAETGIVIDGEDLAGEMQYCVNTQLSYGGISPHACLYGQLPREFFTDETDS
jgi:hypothetical protein